ncbi:MAG: hypothetical protein HOP08_12225 [Cyclobacteriaceae bacterium]|nr:hypothetical protein [Cyclobacteriaceae bacterium]
MTNSRKLAKLIGPSIIVLTISEAYNSHIWVNNTAAGVYLNGSLLFVAGLSIVLNHNLWGWHWPTLITLTGCMAILLGLFRMFAPETQLKIVDNNVLIIGEAMIVFGLGVFLTFKAYTSY